MSLPPVPPLASPSNPCKMESPETLLVIEALSAYNLTDPAPIAQGALSLLLENEPKRYTLTLASLSFHLESTLQVVKGNLNTYCLIKEDQMTVISGEQPIPDDAAEILDMVFAENTHFIVQNQEQTELERVQVVDAEVQEGGDVEAYEIIDSEPPDQDMVHTRKNRLRDLYSKGKETIKKGLTKGAVFAYVTYIKGKVYIKKKFAKKRRVSQPQQSSVSLQQAVQILKEIESKQVQLEEGNPELPEAQRSPEDEIGEIMKNYGGMARRMERLSAQEGGEKVEEEKKE